MTTNDKKLITMTFIVRLLDTYNLDIEDQVDLLREIADSLEAELKLQIRSFR